MLIIIFIYIWIRLLVEYFKPKTHILVAHLVIFQCISQWFWDFNCINIRAPLIGLDKIPLCHMHLQYTSYRAEMLFFFFRNNIIFDFLSRCHATAAHRVVYFTVACLHDAQSKIITNIVRSAGQPSSSSTIVVYAATTIRDTRQIVSSWQSADGGIPDEQ